MHSNRVELVKIAQKLPSVWLILAISRPTSTIFFNIQTFIFVFTPNLSRLPCIQLSKTLKIASLYSTVNLQLSRDPNYVIWAWHLALQSFPSHIRHQDESYTLKCHWLECNYRNNCPRRQWRNDRPCYPCYAGGGTLGGRHISKLTVF